MKGRVVRILAGIGIFALVSGAFYGGMKVGAASGEPGSATDPLVSLSYVEKRISEIPSAGFECISLAAGEKLQLKRGATVIVYTGNATAAGKIIDVTGGGLLSDGKTVEKYHAYLIPADESGLTAKEPCVIFITGERIK